MGKRTRTPDRDAKFFDALESGHTVSAALDASGYSRTAVYAWRKRYPRFAAAWANADDIALAALEAEADRRTRMWGRSGIQAGGQLRK
ncbi:MAG: hypothetical protein ABL996_03835 [Micropepsaceae bacterium]